MTQFPAIEPDKRAHRWGDAPQALSILAGGVETRGNLTAPETLAGEALTLSFPLATWAEAELIRAHYRATGDGLQLFDLPEPVTRADGLMISRGEVWRYSAPPSEDDLGTGRVALTVTLEATATNWVAPPITWTVTLDGPLEVPAVSFRLLAPAPGLFPEIIVPPVSLGFAAIPPGLPVQVPVPTISLQLATPAPAASLTLQPPPVGFQLAAPAPEFLADSPFALRRSDLNPPTVANVYLFPDVASALAAATAQEGGGDNGSGGTFDELYFFDAGGGTTNWVINSFFDLANVRGPFSSDFYYGALQPNAALQTHLDFITPLYAGALTNFEYYGSA